MAKDALRAGEMCKCLESSELWAVNGPEMFSWDWQLRNETLIALYFIVVYFLVDRITKQMDGGIILVVKYLGFGSLLM